MTTHEDKDTSWLIEMIMNTPETDLLTEEETRDAMTRKIPPSVDQWLYGEYMTADYRRARASVDTEVAILMEDGEERRKSLALLDEFTEIEDLEDSLI
jgi:hypothetical protein